MSQAGILSVSSSGGGQPIISIEVDANTAPGTDPVLATAAGQITITGGQTAPATINNVIQTDSLAANTFTIEIQQTSAVAAKDVTKNGVSHFNSTNFTDDEGFIGSQNFTITAGTGLSGGGALTLGGSTTLNAVGGGVSWSVVTVDTTFAVNTGTIANKAGTLLMALPAASAVGDIIEITGMNNALGWQITQAVGQQIFFGNTQTTLGVAGSLASAATRDSLKMVCIIANTTWNVLSTIGNISVV